ncbi:hypothetical protein C7S18_05910 [Ahniella affigens]|uniref:Uncharacterized protein n=1 Tax=Ahniella affigens TaxID=2021234 RepID=A0A2P1PPI7_9GAMM|nr:hypothetical protein [Ahniella affigens]AVP96760.1 hypothetical protein C7S18_05910 [Ahniella affigens]
MVTPTIGLIAGESKQVLVRCLDRLRQVFPDLTSRCVVADAHVELVAEALRDQDAARQRRIVLAAAQSLQAKGASELVLLSWRLHAFSEQIAETVSAPVVAIDALLGRQLQIEGLTQAGFLAHSDAYMHPDVRYRMATRDEVDLICPNEDAFEILDSVAVDGGFESLDARALERLRRYLQFAWQYQHLRAVVTERQELAHFARVQLQYPIVMCLEQLWADAIIRRLNGEPDRPAPLARQIPYLSVEQTQAAEQEVCRRLKCDPRVLDFALDRQGELALYVPNLPGAAELPAQIEGVTIIVTK